MDLSSNRRPFFQSPRLFRRTELPPSLIGTSVSTMTSQLQNSTMTSSMDKTKNLTSSVNGQVDLTSSLNGQADVTSGIEKIPSSSLGLILATAEDDVRALEDDVRETAILSDSDNSPSRSPREDEQVPAADKTIDGTASSEGPAVGTAENRDDGDVDRPGIGTSGGKGSGSLQQTAHVNSEPPSGQASEEPDAEIPGRRGSDGSDHSGSCIPGKTGTASTKRPLSDTFDSTGNRYLAPPPGRGRSERTGIGGPERAASTRTVKDVDRSHAISSLRDFRNRVVEFESLRRRPRSSSSSSGRIAPRNNMAAATETQERELQPKGSKGKVGGASSPCHSPSGENVLKNDSGEDSRKAANVSEPHAENRGQVNSGNKATSLSSTLRNSDADRKNVEPKQLVSDASGKPSDMDKKKQVLKSTTFSLVSELKVKYRTGNDPVADLPKASSNISARDASPDKTVIRPKSLEKQASQLKPTEGSNTQEVSSQGNNNEILTNSSSNSAENTESSREEHAGNTESSREEHAGNTESSREEHAGNTESSREEQAENTESSREEHAGNTESSRKEHAGNTESNREELSKIVDPSTNSARDSVEETTSNLQTSATSPPSDEKTNPDINGARQEEVATHTSNSARTTRAALDLLEGVEKRPEPLEPRRERTGLLPERVSPLRDHVRPSSTLSASSHSVLSDSGSSSPRDSARSQRLSQDSRSSSEPEVPGSVLGVVVQTTCSACHEEYTAPRILPCLHTFCSRCIAEFVSYPANSGCRESGASSRDSLVGGSTPNGPGVEGVEGEGDRRTVLCPECVREVDLPEDLDLLPRNFVVERRLVQMAAQASDSRDLPPGGVTEPAAILLCDCCGEGEAGSSAMVRCNACRENLCALCEEAHRRQKRTRHHVLHVITSRDVANMAGDVEPETFCPQHSQERLSLFCTSCAVPVCRECAGAEKHRRHKTEPLDAELFHAQMQDVHRLARQAAPRVAAMETQLRHMSDVRARLRARAKEVEAEVQSFMDSYVDALEKHRKSLLTQISAILEDKERAIDATKRHLSDVKTDVERTCRFVSEMLGCGTDMEILSVKGLITERLRRVNALASKPRLSVTDFLRFCPQQPADVINNFQMFGQVLCRQACPARSCLANDGAVTTARVGHKTTLTLLVKDTEGLPYPGSDVSVQAWLIFQNEAQKGVAVWVSRLQEGQHSLSFTPQQQGPHSLHVAVDGQAIKKSPFKVVAEESPMRVGVKGKWREHRGVFQCCTFCHTGGKRDVACACNARMPGGYLGCGHGHPGHPGGPHWSCCGKMAEGSECGAPFTQRASPVRQVTL